MQEKGFRSVLLGVVIIVLEISMLWAAFGYLSLRTFCNISGLPLIDNVNFQRYFEESYYLFIFVAAKFVSDPFFFLTLLLCCIVSIVSLFIDKRRPTKTAIPLRWVNTAWLLPIWVLVCSFGYTKLSVGGGQLSQDLLVGDLVSEKLQGTGDFKLSIVLALFASCGVWLLKHPSGKVLSHPAEWSRRALLVALWLLAVLSVMNIPVLFGTLLANRVVHVVQLHLEGEASSICVARIMESPTQFLYWYAVEKRGFVKSAAVSKIGEIDYVRSASLLTLAIDASRSDQSQPLCNDPAGDTK